MPFDLSYAAARLTMRKDDIVLAYGSGFLYRRKDKHFLVTAWHNLSGRRSDTLKPLDQKNGALPNNLVAGLGLHYQNPDGLGGYFRLPITVPFDDGSTTKYRVHKQSWPRVDVAVLEISLDQDFLVELNLSDGTQCQQVWKLDFTQDDGAHFLPVFLSDTETSTPIPDEWSVTHSVGDDLFLLGYPMGITDQNLMPIWKRASIATEPDQNWNGQEQMLVDAASREGMSGCAAIYYSKVGVVPVYPGSSLQISVPLHIIHGVYVGRLGSGQLEAQLGIVWKKSVIDEIIDDGRDAFPTEKIECAVSDVVEVIENEWPETFDTTAYIRDEAPLYYFLHHIMEKLDGRNDPDFVVRKIKESAASKAD